MSGKQISVIVFAAVCGALAGAGGFYLAQSRGLFPDWGSATSARQHDDHDDHPQQHDDGRAGHDDQDHDDHEGHAHQDRDGDEVEHDHVHAEGPDDHAAHGDRDEESFIQLSETEMERYGMEVAVAGPGGLATEISLPGEIVLNEDRVAHIVPRAPGIVREVLKNVGDTVSAGEVMAWLESAELGAAKVGYLAKWAELGCYAVDLTRAREVRDNTMHFLEVLGSAPSLEMLRDMNGGTMGQNRSDLVSAYAEFVLAEAAYAREKQLLAKELASERDFQAAEAEYKKADALYIATRDRIAFTVYRDLLETERAQQVRKIELQGAHRRLSVLGLTSEDIAELRALAQLQTSPPTRNAQCTDPHCKNCQSDATNPAGVATATVDEERLAWYPLRAPFDGRVIEKHLTLGEKHGDDAGAFTVADMSSVWLNIAVYEKDLPYVKEGVNVAVTAGADLPSAHGVVAYVSSVVNEKTRTALARVVLPNLSGDWRPGLFVSAGLAIGENSAAIVVPKAAIQRMGEEQIIFLDTSEGLKPVPVTLGRGNASHVEVLSGLSPGQRYVARGAFELKAKIVTSGLDAHAGHGH